jgi:hypothetical protein
MVGTVPTMYEYIALTENQYFKGTVHRDGAFPERALKRFRATSYCCWQLGHKFPARKLNLLCPRDRERVV